MIGYVMVGTNDLDKAIRYYDEVLKVLDLERKETDEVCAGYAQSNGDGSIEFYVTKPVNKKTATFGNGTQVSFLTKTRAQVVEFHKTGLDLGGKNEGDPGLRPNDGDVFYAYVRDLEGNKICAYTNSKD